MGWLTGLLCAEFLSKEEEEMPAIPYIIRCHLPRRRETAVAKTAFTHSFVLGSEYKPEAVGLVNKSVANHANGSASICIRTGELGE